MAASGYTPISLYYSTTAAAAPVAGNLTNGELAINITDGKLYYKDNTGTVQLLASKAALTSVDSISFGTTGLTPATATTGAVTVAGTLNVANGGTGLTSLTAGYIPFGNGTSAFGSSANLFWDGTNLSVKNGGNINSLSPDGTVQGWMVAANTGQVDISAYKSTGASYLAFKTGSGTERMRLDSTGNLGLGVTPNAWDGANWTALQLKYGASLSGLSGGYTVLGQNFYGASGGDKYIADGYASEYYQRNSAHVWRIAASGLADGAISWTSAMTLDASGNLGIGITSPATRLDVYNGGIGSQAVFGGANAPATISTNTGTGTFGGNVFMSTGGVFYAKATASSSTDYASDGSTRFFNNSGLTVNSSFSRTERMRLDSSGNLLLGTTAQYNGGKFEMAGTSSDFVSTRFVNAAGGANIYLQHSRGASVGTNTILQAGDPIGTILFSGANGTGYSDAAYIQGSVDGTPGATADMPGRLGFFTSADGSATPTERMRIDSSGNLGLGVTPQAWASGQRVFELAGSSTANIVAYVNGLSSGTNYYVNSGGTLTYAYTGQTATRYEQRATGQHIWYTAPSGTAGTAITFTQAMTLNASGQLSVGSTSAGTNAIVDITSTSNSDTVFPLQVYSNNRAASLSMSYGAISASSNLVLYSSGTSNYAILNTSGNLGLGVSPAAWESGAKVIQMSTAGAGGTSGNYGSIWARSDTIRLINAAYFDSGSYRYAVTGVAPNMLSMSNDGAFYFTKAASGTAGNSFSFTNQMVLDATGYLLLTSATPRIQIIPATATNNALVQFQNTGGNVYVGTDSSAGGLTAPYALNLYHSGAYPIVFTTNSSERMRIDSSGNVLIGTTTTTNNLRLNAKLAVVATGTSSYGGANFTTYSGTTAVSGSFLDFNRSRGTVDGSMTIVANNDTLGYLVFRGSDGTNFVNSAQIQADVDGTPGSNDMPGRLMFLTTADGASSPTERMRIDSSGNVLFAKAVRASITTDNDLSFDMNAASNFKCTPTAGGALTFTNITSGQTGNIILVNGANYAITAAATTKVSATCLATISATGTYWLSYYSDGTNVYVANTGALA